MLCDMCHKSGASVHLTEIIDNQITELHLCEECARQKGAQMEQHFGLADLLAGLTDLGQQFEVGAKAESKCANCDLTYQDFRRIGRLGCSECYRAFKDNLGVLLKRIHGSAEHLGRAPANVKSQVVKKKTQEEILRAKLEKAIGAEEFEEAATLRDAIRALQAKKKKK